MGAKAFLPVLNSGTATHVHAGNREVSPVPLAGSNLVKAGQTKFFSGLTLTVVESVQLMATHLNLLGVCLKTF